MGRNRAVPRWRTIAAVAFFVAATVGAYGQRSQSRTAVVILDALYRVDFADQSAGVSTSTSHVPLSSLPRYKIEQL